ncbi:hypothetical protein HF520_10635 [Romboutsia sp. CE17]|nr:hypothetical protein [Romboutsia sp. CE17]QJA09386.1 hypothetical protein HF520_10635 [Romboutsia sp. CE17]
MQIERFILLYLTKNTNKENDILIYELSKEYLKFLHFHDTSTKGGQNQ